MTPGTGDARAAARGSGIQLAGHRTWLAHERTLMAWVRTAASLISFGFTIDNFFGFDAGRTGTTVRYLLSPRQFAMVMIGTGLVALCLGTIDHHQSISILKAEFGTSRRSLAGVVAALISVLGILAFVAVLVQR